MAGYSGLLSMFSSPSLNPAAGGQYGLLDPQMQQQLKQQQLMGLAQGLLSASGPSKTPVGFGQALGTGLQQSQQSGNDYQDNLIKQLTLAATLKKAQATDWGETKDAFGNPVAYNKDDPSKTMNIGQPYGAFGSPQTAGTSQPAMPQANGQSPSQPNLNGDDYLKTLPKPIADQVKAISEGRMPVPGGFALKSPYWQQMMSAVSYYDPTFDSVNYNARSKTRNDFVAGKSRQNINSIETALNTLAQAQDASDKLGGYNELSFLTGPVNALRAGEKGLENDPNLNTYNNLAKAAADETTKAIVSTGGTGHDRQTRENLFRAGQSPNARKASFSAAGQELLSRLDPLADSYNQGMGTTKDKVELLSPKAQAAYKKIFGTPSAQPPQGGIKFLGFE